MNTSADSSFAPLEYYKKLTNCLANRKNLKLNISKIQGSRDYRLRSTPFITNRKLQIKFLANYCLRKQFNENQRQQRAKLASKNDEAIFKVKNNNNAALNEKLKRKTNEESYINLPDSYFKANQLPDLSLFKVPGIPPIKRQKIQFLPNTVNTSNFTLASLFSGNFEPQLCSTPMEQPIIKNNGYRHPLITDPDEILGPLKNMLFREDDNNYDDEMNERILAARAMDKLKAYKNFVEDVAYYVESVCFGELTDAIIAMIEELFFMHEEASQTPRATLFSSGGIQVGQNAFPQSQQEVKKTQAWPIPVFYDIPNENTANNFANDNDDDINPLFENTSDLFSFLDEDDPLDIGTSAVEFDDQPTTSRSSFFNNTPHPSANTFLASTQFTLTPYPRSNIDELDWLGNRFASSLDMSWGNDSNFSFASNRNNMHSDISAIFRSPPNSNNLETKKAFDRAISRPKSNNNKNNRSDSDGSREKEAEFTWWYNDSGNSPNNTFLQNDTQNLFGSNFSLF